LDNTDGVLVDSISMGSPAQLAEPALSPGDVLRSIDGKPIKDLAELIARYEEVMEMEDLPEYLLVEFDRMGQNQMTLLKPKPDEDVDPPREVAKAWIGVAVQPVVKKLAEQMNIAEHVGFRITRVYPHTLAAETDLKVGDIILSLDDDRLKPRGMQDAGLFHRQVRRLSIGEKAKVTVLRDEKEIELTVPLERTRIGPDEALRDNNRDFEMVVRETTFFDRDDNRWDESINGVILERVEPAGWAQLGGLRPRDLIQRIGEFEIGDLEQYREAIKKITEQQPERVVFVVLRGVSTHFQYVEPEWKPTSDADDDESNKEDQP
jgi:S1-C subfamily serine protease